MEPATPAAAPSGAPPAPAGAGGLAPAAARRRRVLRQVALGLIGTSAVFAVVNLAMGDATRAFLGALAFFMTIYLFLVVSGSQLLPKGPKLQFLNLSILFTVIYLSRYLPALGIHTFNIDYPNPFYYVIPSIALGAVLDAVASRYRFGEWRVPWPTMVGSLGITLVVDGLGWLPFVLLPIGMVASKHLIRWRGKHLFNPNNFAACILILAFLVRVGVNDWGAAPQTVALMLFFGSIATSRVKRLDLALMYLLLSFGVYGLVALAEGWGLATVWLFAFSPLQVVIGFFAITDPATSPNGRLEKFLWALLLVLLGVPATLAGFAVAPIFALFLGAPQRHLISYLVTGKWPPPTAVAPEGKPKPAAPPSAPGPSLAPAIASAATAATAAPTMAVAEGGNPR